MNTYEYILKKYNLNPKQEFFIEIPNIGRNNLANLFAELGFNLGAEIGVAVGHYSEILCQANPNLHLYSIDPWKISAYEPDVIPSQVAIVETQEQFDAEYEEAKKRLVSYNCTIVRKDSLAAAKDFADNSFDFVYIDANHDFVNATNDIDTWKKKVRPGGVLAGHDYKNFSLKKRNHVKWVVDAYMQVYSMLPCFIVGAGVVHDHAPSWFWVKT